MNSPFWKRLSKFYRCFTHPNIVSFKIEENRFIYLQSVNYRARQSTRLRKFLICRRNKARKEALLLKQPSSGYVPYLKKKQKEGTKFVSKKISDEGREVSPDNVWIADMFKFRVFSFTEAVNAHREIYDSSLYDDPNAPIHAYIELDMTTDKLTKFYESFTNVVSVNYPYKHFENRSILVFCKLKDQMDAVLERGATLAGGTDIIKLIKRGKIVLPDFDFVIAHPNIMPELMVIRGLLKRRFPSSEKGSLGVDLISMVNNLRAGIKYEAKRDEFEQDYGYVDVKLGDLQMETAHMEDNFRMLLANINISGPERTKRLENYKFITRAFITSPLFNEKLLVSLDEYLKTKEYDSDDEVEAKRRQ